MKGFWVSTLEDLGKEGEGGGKEGEGGGKEGGNSGKVDTVNK